MCYGLQRTENITKSSSLEQVLIYHVVTGWHLFKSGGCILKVPSQEIEAWKKQKDMGTKDNFGLWVETGVTYEMFILQTVLEHIKLMSYFS